MRIMNTYKPTHTHTHAHAHAHTYTHSLYCSLRWDFGACDLLN